MKSTNRAKQAIITFSGNYFAPVYVMFVIVKSVLTGRVEFIRPIILKAE
jgi:hypothetical protein